MKKIIGGLLVVSLLSRPSLLKVDAIAYEILKSQQRLLSAIKSEEDRKESEMGKIEEELNTIGNNTREIAGLIKEKNKITAKIQTALDLRAHTRSSMNEEQISLFRGFHSYLEEESPVLQENMRKIDEKKELTLAKKEILHSDADYTLIYQELKSISDDQSDVLVSLNSMIDSGQKTLDALCT